MTTEVPPPPLPTPPAELPPMHALRKLVEAFGRNDHDMITVRTPRNGTRIVMPKYVLRLHSPFMMRLLKESPRKRVIEVNAEDRVLEKLLRFMHTGRVAEWQGDERALFELAVCYEMGTLRALCVREICRNLTVDNFFSTIDFTLGRSNDAFLCRWLLDFGVRNFDQLLLKPGWAAFFEQQAALCLAMIKRAHYHE